MFLFVVSGGDLWKCWRHFEIIQKVEIAALCRHDIKT